MSNSEIDKVEGFPGDNEIGKETEELPYPLSKEELTYQPKEGKAWLRRLIARQRSDIEQGRRPQYPWSLTDKKLVEVWRNQVWEYWISTRPSEEQQVIRATTGEPQAEWGRISSIKERS